MNREPSVQREIAGTRRWLQSHRWLRLHVGLIALCCLACLWCCGALLRHFGMESLALRFGISLSISYGAYLLLLRLWAAYLLSREDGDLGDALDVADIAVDAGLGDGVGSALDAASSLDEGALVLLPIAALVGMVLALAAVLGAGVGLLFGVGLGAALDRWVPEAESLPHAVRIWRSH